MTKTTVLSLLSIFALSACMGGGAQTTANQEPSEPMAEEIAEPTDGFATND